MRTLLFLTLLWPPFAGADKGPTSHGCSEVTFNISLRSENIVFASPPDPNNTTAIVNFMVNTWLGDPPSVSGTAIVTGNYSIRGTYCVPPQPKHPLTLQILVHGITYNRTMWSGLGFSPDDYSWHAHANVRGYATLALDRLGHGESSRPDPLNAVQAAAHLDLLRQVASLARAGSGGVFSHNFQKVVLVGHSYGSSLSIALAGEHPSLADAMVITGFSGTAVDISNIRDLSWDSAANVHPARFAGVAKGYVTMADTRQRTTAFYYPRQHDPVMPPVDFAVEDTVTVGEVGASAVVQTAAGYNGPVLVVTGDRDRFFCPGGPGQSCAQILEETGRIYFPDATRYEWLVVPETGHVLTLHYAARETMRKVHDWLDQTL